MKRTLTLAALMVSAASAMAGAVDVPTVTAGTTYRPCDGGVATATPAKIWGGSGTPIPTGSTAVFTRVGFNIICSGNVFLGIQEVSANGAVVASGSAKGNQYFSGHSNGGAIAAGGKCTGTNDACGTTDVDTGISNAKTAAGF